MTYPTPIDRYKNPTENSLWWYYGDGFVKYPPSHPVTSRFQFIKNEEEDEFQLRCFNVGEVLPSEIGVDYGDEDSYMLWEEFDRYGFFPVLVGEEIPNYNLTKMLSLMVTYNVVDIFKDLLMELEI